MKSNNEKVAVSKVPPAALGRAAGGGGAKRARELETTIARNVAEIIEA